MKIAIVGTGISGLTAAHQLYKEHEISVFEKNSYIGGHSNTIDVDENGHIIPIDTGFIVFNDWTYPNFEKLISGLNIEIENSEMSFSAKSNDSNFSWCGKGIKGLAFNKNNWYQLKSYQILFDFLRFNRIAKTLLSKSKTDITLGEFLTNNHFSKTFINYYILPMGAAIWSSSMDDINTYPAHSFLSFFDNHGLLNIKYRPQWKTIVGGSRQYVAELSKPFCNKIKLNSNIKTIHRHNNNIVIHFEDNNTQDFDQIILACHSDQALQLLSQPSNEEINTLGNIKYQPNEAVLHTDASLMPEDINAWSAWNYLLPKDNSEIAKVTYYMNRLQPLNSQQNYFVSLNLTDRISENKIIRKITYQHPVFDSAAINAQNNREFINGKQNTWYCGAYWRNGFHEDGVWSAVSTIKQLKHELSLEDNSAQLHLQRAS